VIAEHAPNIAAYYAERPDIEAAVKAADGQMYYIPYLPDGKYGRAYWIRTDWLEALDLEVPQTVDEYEAVLRAFKTQDPNGNGEADEVPFFARQWPELIRLVGLIDVEIFTRGSSARDFLLSENLGGSTHDWFASTSGYNSLSSEIDGFEFKAFAPPASPSGRRIEEHRRILVKPDGWAIGHTNEHAVETIKYFDFWFSEEGRRLANFGVEGQQYDMVDGKPIFKQEFLDAGPVNRSLYQVGAQLQGRGYFQDYNYEIQWSNEFALEGIALYDEGDYLIPDFLGVAFDADEQKIYDRTWGTIRDYMLERQQSWVLGNGDVNAEWDDYLAQLDELGWDELMGVMQSAYDRQYGG